MTRGLAGLPQTIVPDFTDVVTTDPSENPIIPDGHAFHDNAPRSDGNPVADRNITLVLTLIGQFPPVHVYGMKVRIDDVGLLYQHVIPDH